MQILRRYGVHPRVIHTHSPSPQRESGIHDKEEVSVFVSTLSRIFASPVSDNFEPAPLPVVATPSGQATVDAIIQPSRTGRVRFQGSWWSARCDQNVTISPGEVVRVIGRQNITLVVEPLPLSLSS